MDFANIVSTVGFPIAACGFMGWYCKYTLDKFMAMVGNIEQKYRPGIMAIVSELAALRMFSPCHSGKRTHEIDTITPHCVVGQMTADSLGHLFQDRNRQASCNYAIGRDGTIICIVPEEYRSW